MEGADALGLIAEVGIAIAGFAGVIAALRAQGGRIEPYAALRIGAVLGISASAVLLALLPMALHFAAFDGQRIWTLSSGGMAMLVAALFFVPDRLAISWRAVPEEDRPPGIRLVRPIWIAVTASNVVLQMVNVGILQDLWPFFLGLLIMTAHSLFSFAYILLAPSRAEVRV